MWSASSSTVISTASRIAKPCFMRSSRRPGVATRCRRRSSAHRPGVPARRRRRSSSPSGGLLRERGDRRLDLGREFARRGEDETARATATAAGRPAPERRITRGRAKARVFPEPVLPRPSTSVRRACRGACRPGSERLGLALVGEHAHEGVGHAESGEGGGVRDMEGPFGRVRPRRSRAQAEESGRRRRVAYPFAARNRRRPKNGADAF